MPETSIPITINSAVELPITVSDDAVEIAVSVPSPVMIEVGVISAEPGGLAAGTYSDPAIVIDGGLL